MNMDKRDWNYLIQMHDKAKNHPFREHFAAPEELRNGVWKSEFEDFRKTLVELTYTVNDIIWSKCYKDGKVDYNKYGNWCVEKTKWVHNFIGLLQSLKAVYSIGVSPSFLEKELLGLNITVKELYDMDKLTDISYLMIYFDRFIGYIHNYIETGVLTDITYVVLEKTTNPHNGHYYRYLCIAHIDEDGKWKLEDKVPYRGQKNISNE